MYLSYKLLGDLFSERFVESDSGGEYIHFYITRFIKKNIQCKKVLFLT